MKTAENLFKNPGFLVKEFKKGKNMDQPASA